MKRLRKIVGYALDTCWVVIVAAWVFDIYGLMLAGAVVGLAVCVVGLGTWLIKE